MAAPPSPPDDDLRRFLLGTLSAERVEAVRVWLGADPAHAARLDGLAPRDPLTAALADRVADEPLPPAAVERVVRGVTDALRNTPTADAAATVAGLDPGGRPARADGSEPAWHPERLGPYRVVREIGRGGMGVVLEVADDTLNRRVAAKVLNPDLARKPDAGARFLREARAAAAVEHDHVVPILHVGSDGGAAYIVMPLLKGEPLDKRLKRDGPLPVPEVVRVGREVAAGLGAAHACGLVHRDMKPANVWLDADTGRARVLDFGLARQGDGTDALTEAGKLLGTPAYMAPEQVDGLPTDARSDLFALGAILYECATGRRAFPGATVTAVLKAVATHTPDPPAAVNPAVPAELSALIMRLLEKAPAERPASTAEVAAALARVPVVASAGGTKTLTWVDREARSPRKRRFVWAVGGAAVAVLAAVAIGIGTRDRPADGPAPASPKDGSDAPAPREVRAPGSGAGVPERGFAEARYRGKVDVKLARTKNDPLERLNVAGALPMRQSDVFRIEGEIDPPAYLYVVWVDPGHDVTGVYPWDPRKDDWRGTRPGNEEPVRNVSLPRELTSRYTAPRAKPGVATIVMFARPTPLDVSDDEVKKWFESMPEIALPQNGDAAAVWFENFAEVQDPLRLRTFGTVNADDPFAQGQKHLKALLANKVDFQTAVSFARKGTTN
jgi:hypothetical protein